LSTEPLVRPRGAACRAGVALFATWAVTWARGADVDFRPTMSFGLFHDGNISVTGGTHGDENAALAFDFAVDRKTPTSALTFSYRPAYVAYRRATDLNYFGNTIVLGYAADASRESRYTFDMYVSRTDYQGLTQNTQDQAVAFVPRTTLTQGHVKVTGTHGAGRRGFVDWQLRGGTERYKDLSDNPATTVLDVNGVNVSDPVDFNDSTSFGGRLAWRSELSARNTLGAALDVAHFGYESTPSVVVETVGLVGTSRVGQLWTLEYAAGASRATMEDDSISGFSFNATIEYEVERASTFSAGARQVFAPGTGLGGSTQDRGVWVAYGHTPTAKGLSGSVVGGYWQRSELAFASSTVTAGDSQSFNVNGSLGWNFNRYLALNAAYAFIDQSGRNGAPESLDTHYSSYGLYLRWAIRGR
jgi:hypothetical protein